MNSRIEKLYKKTLNGEMYVTAKPTQYTNQDSKLSPLQKNASKVYE